MLTAGPASFANAVLRRVGERDEAAWVALLAEGGDELDRLCLAHAHPRWIAAAFADALGGDLADTGAALAADDTRPRVHLVARPGRVDRATLLAQAGEGAEAGPWAPCAVRLAVGGDPAALPAVKEGLAGVQDEGSQLVATALTLAPLQRPRHRAGSTSAPVPGGKAALLAAHAAGRGAHLLAAEIAPHRAGLVARSVRRAARPPPWSPTAPGRPGLAGSFDRVMLDAPCTGLGALRRRPEARWRRRPEDLASLTALQRDLLAQALRAARPGGVVAYVVCSPHLAETVLAVREASAPRPRHRGARRPVRAAGRARTWATGPFVQLWPHRHGTDAMFLALLRVAAV